MSGYDLSQIPLAAPPPGQISNLVDPPSRAWVPRVSIYTTLPVALGFVILRYWARFKQKLALSWDDCKYGDL